MTVIQVTAAQLIHIRPTVALAVAALAAPRLEDAMAREGIDTPLEAAHFLTQVGYESGFAPVEENLNYNPARLMIVWPGRYPTLAIAQDFARRGPVAIAEHSYGGRYGNGPEGSGDGWKFRGRGAFQLTFEQNYDHMAKRIGYDLVAYPEAAKQYGIGARIAAAYWKDHGFDGLAARDSLTGITKGVNGSAVTAPSRAPLLARAKVAFGVKTKSAYS